MSLQLVPTTMPGFEQQAWPWALGGRGREEDIKDQVSRHDDMTMSRCQLSATWRKWCGLDTKVRACLPHGRHRRDAHPSDAEERKRARERETDADNLEHRHQTYRGRSESMRKRERGGRDKGREGGRVDMIEGEQ